MKYVLIRTVDTDIVVMAIFASFQLQNNIFLAFGTGNNYRFFSAHELAAKLDGSKCSALLLFRAFSGCDTVVFQWKRKEVLLECFEQLS